jgi:P27 family predicted phage terminase small subunit
MRGRKPKPSHLRVVDGNPGRRPLNEDEPQTKAEIPDAPPHWLSDTAKDVYTTTLKDCPEGLLRDLDLSMFARWCFHHDQFRQAQDAVSRYGQFVKNGKSPVPAQNPALAVANKQSLIMAKLEAEMGFTPSSRSRVRIDRKNRPASAFGALKTFGEDD